MSHKINPGDLIYVPSEVFLYKEKDQVSDLVKIQKPINLLVTGVNPKTFTVFYKDSYWLVDRQEVYNI